MPDTLTPLERELLEACRCALASYTDPYYFTGHSEGERGIMRRRQALRQQLRAAIAKAEAVAKGEETDEPVR